MSRSGHCRNRRRIGSAELPHFLKGGEVELLARDGAPVAAGEQLEHGQAGALAEDVQGQVLRGGLDGGGLVRLGRGAAELHVVHPQRVERLVVQPVLVVLGRGHGVGAEIVVVLLARRQLV